MVADLSAGLGMPRSATIDSTSSYIYIVQPYNTCPGLRGTFCGDVVSIDGCVVTAAEMPLEATCTRGHVTNCGPRS